MKTYIATSGNESYSGNILNCIHWSNEVISEIPAADTIVKIHRIRSEQKYMRIVFEVTSDGIRKIEGGRVVPLRSYKKAFSG